MQQFRHITASFTLCWPGHDHTPTCQYGKTFPVEATEWRGTGLAIQHMCHPSRLQEYYGILHVASGRLVTGETTPTLIEAALWLRSLKDLTDWTQPGELLQGREELRNYVYEVREQAMRQYARMLGDGHEGRWEYADSCTSEGTYQA